MSRYEKGKTRNGKICKSAFTVVMFLVRSVCLSVRRITRKLVCNVTERCVV